MTSKIKKEWVVVARLLITRSRAQVRLRIGYQRVLHHRLTEMQRVLFLSWKYTCKFAYSYEISYFSLQTRRINTRQKRVWSSNGYLIAIQCNVHDSLLLPIVQSPSSLVVRALELKEDAG